MVVQELVALLGVKTDKSSVDKAENGMKGLINMAKAAAAAFAAIGVVRWVTGVVDQVAKAGDRLDKMAQRTGIAHDVLQQFSHAAELSGASLNDVEASIKRLQTAQSDASYGLETYTREFKRLGVEIKDKDGTFKDTTQLLLEVADGMKNLDSDTERTAVAVKLLGRSGTTLIPLLKQGGGAVRDMMLEVQELGGMMSDDLRAASAKYIDNQQRMKVATDGIKYAIGNELLPVLNDLTDSTIEWWKNNGKIIRQNVASFFKGLGSVVNNVAGFFQKVTSWAFKFFQNLDPLSKKILTLTGLFGGLLLLFRAGPVGKFLLLIGLIALAIDDLNVFLEGGNSALGKFLDWVKDITGIDFAPWIREAADAFSILAADPEPFDWNMYFEEVNNVIYDYLMAASQTWKEIWSDIWSWYSDLFVDNPLSDYLGSAIDAFVSFWTFLYDGFGALITFFMDVWTGPSKAWDSFYNKIVGGAENLFNKISSLGGAIKGLFGFGENSPTAKGVQNVAVAGSAGATVRGAQKVAAAGSVGATVSGAGIAPFVRATGGGPQSYTNAPTVNVGVKALPGMNERRLASETGKEVAAALDRENRKTMQAFANTKATG